MRHESVLAALEKHAKDGTARIYRRHGARDPVLGVSYAAMKTLLKRLGTDHDLARALWKTGVHEARVVATKVADPARLSRAEVERWLDGVSDYIVADALSGLVARVPDGLAWASEWIESEAEFVSAAGWNVLNVRALEGGLSEAEAKRLLARIKKGIKRAPNRTRYAMNGALIGIGGAMPALSEQAVSVARAIGQVEVDHGETSCKTPDAESYIARMRERAAKRTRVTGARMKAARG
ncbi:MAG: DNA alkylation repair protein [Gemmatimonadales bacterium]